MAVHRMQRGGAVLSAAPAAALIQDYLKLRNGEMVDPIKRLSQRERQVLEMVLNGKTSSQIAELLAISPKSVGTYRCRIMAKLGVSNAPGLVKFAITHGLVDHAWLGSGQRAINVARICRITHPVLSHFPRA